VLVALSEAGQCLIDRFRERRNAVFGEALSQLSEEEQTQVVSSLQKVITVLANFEAKSVGGING
jgi:DNA-binding MarR family transcriptional regulator